MNTIRIITSTFALAAFLCACTSDHTSQPQKLAPASPLRIHVDGHGFVDELGRTVILRGVGTNQLGEYFQGITNSAPVIPLVEDDFCQMAALGMNSVRLVITWSNLEPEPGVRNEAQLAKIKEAVAWAKKYDIYTILDMHQDAWGITIATPLGYPCEGGREYNQGWDGAPKWATLTDGASPCRMAMRELSPAVMHAWENFWRNTNGIQDHFIDTWAWLADAFKDESAVIAYDLINEPNWGLDWDWAVDVGKPAMYRKATEAIRQVEAGRPPKIIIFEPTALWSAIPGERPVPFTTDTQIVYGPHVYGGVDEAITGKRTVAMHSFFDLAYTEARGYGTFPWIGEWGASIQDVTRAVEYSLAEDLYHMSGARWVWRVACGDPHGVNWPAGTSDWLDAGSIYPYQCGVPGHPEGIPMGLEPTHGYLLGRPYPVRFSGDVQFRWDRRSDILAMTATVGLPAPEQEIWIPGAGQPTVEAKGAKITSLAPSHEGWRLFMKPAAPRWTALITPSRPKK